MKHFYQLGLTDTISVHTKYFFLVCCLVLTTGLQAQVSSYDAVSDWDVYPAGNFSVQEVADTDASDQVALEVTTNVSTQNWWEGLVQTFQNNTPTVVQGNEYTVRFRHKAETDRQLWVRISSRERDTYGTNDVAYFDEFINVSTTYQDFSFTFRYEDTVDGSVHVQLFAGGDDTAFLIDDFDITVIEGTPPAEEEAYDTVADWDPFPVDNFSITVEADTDAVNGSAIKVSTLVPTENWYDGLVQTFQNNTPAIVSGNEYTVRFRHKAETDRQVWVIVATRPTDTYGSDDVRYFNEFVDLSTGYQDFSYTFTAADTDSGSVHVQLYGGGDDAAFFIDDFDITVIEGTPPEEEAYDTVADWDPFPVDNFSITEEADTDAVNGSAIKFATEIATVNWYDALLQTFQSNTPALAEGSQYTVRFRHKAEADRQIRVVISGRPTDTYGPEDNQYYSEFVNVSTTYQDFSFNFTATDTVPGSVHVQLFAGGDETSFFVDDFDITIDNGNPPTGEEPFEDVDKWNTYAAGDLNHEIVSDDNAVNGQAFKVSPVTSVANKEWYDTGFQILQDEGVVEENGKRYTISFRYRADSDRQFWLALKSRPYNTFGSDDTDYFGSFLNATSEYQEFTQTVTSPATVLSTIYIAFLVGGNDTPIYIDNIQMKEAPDLRTEPTTLYVNPIGSDTNPGTSNTADGAFRTIGHALSQIIPGDVLLLADGLYQENFLKLENINGSADLITTVRSINRWGAKIEGTTQYETIFQVLNSSYIEIDGIEVFNNNNVELEDWNAGVQVFGSNHVTVKNVYAHDCGCNGVSGREGDYFTFENNVLQDNAKTNPYNCSGLSIYQPIALDDAPGYHIIIRNNVAFENECRLPFSPLGFTIPTDGNGIILDDFNQTQSEGIPAYTPATLVENNLTFNNGGAGIKVFEVANATIRNNTAWHNNYVLREFSGGIGDIGIQAVNGTMEIYNNIAVEEFGQENGHGLFIQTTDEASVDLQNNIIVGSRSFEGSVPIEEENTFVSVNQQSYPAFVNATTDIQFSSASDFRNYFGLREISPAIDAGNTDLGSAKDLEGIDRPIGSATDIGAYEGPTESDIPLPPDETLVATIQNTQTPIVIDGAKDGAYIGGVNDITKQSVSLEDVSDSNDLSGSWTALWDETNLYLQIAVTDETIIDDSADTIDDDSIEIHIDGDNSKADNYNDDDFIFLLGAESGASLEELLRNDVSGVDAAVVGTNSGYSAEIAIPWSKLGVTPSDSLKIALDIQINDDDTGGTRDSKIAWQDLLEDNTTIPSRFGEGLIIVLPPPPAVVKNRVPVEVDGIGEASWDALDANGIENNVSGEVTDTADLSGTWKAQWDDNALYFFVSVTDDDLQNDSEFWYEDDGVEIYIDSDNSKNTTYGTNDHQLTIGWNNGNLIEDTKNNIGPGSTVAVIDTDQGYDVEVSIPWTALGLTPTTGQFIGLDVHLIDDDEGGARSGKLSWFSQIDEAYRDPSLFGNIFLKGYADGTGNDTIYGEVGNTTGNHVWSTVNYANTYTDPVVVMGPLSTNGNQPATVRVRNSEGTGFQWQVDEWAYLDGPHLVENISYMVVEAGNHIMENGGNLVAGKTDVGTNWTTVSLPPVFGDTPIVVPQVVTVNGGQPVDVRIRNICATSFQLKLQEEENGGDGSGNRAHVIETIGWVAIQKGVASGDGTGLLEATDTGNLINHTNYQLTFAQSYPDAQTVLIGHEQTTNGNDPGTIRFRSNSFTANGVTLFFQEERSKDQETNHLKENFGFVIFGSTGNLVVGDPAANSVQHQNREARMHREIVLYPNPTFGEAKVAMTGMELNRATVTIMDLSGTTVLSAYVSEERNSIDVSSLPRGLYVVKVAAGNDSYTTKLYKQ